MGRVGNSGLKVRSLEKGRMSKQTQQANEQQKRTNEQDHAKTYKKQATTAQTKQEINKTQQGQPDFAFRLAAHCFLLRVAALLLGGFFRVLVSEFSLTRDSSTN